MRKGCSIVDVAGLASQLLDLGRLHGRQLVQQILVAKTGGLGIGEKMSHGVVRADRHRGATVSARDVGEEENADEPLFGRRQVVVKVVAVHVPSRRAA